LVSIASITCPIGARVAALRRASRASTSIARRDARDAAARGDVRAVPSRDVGAIARARRSRGSVERVDRSIDRSVRGSIG